MRLRLAQEPRDMLVDLVYYIYNTIITIYGFIHISHRIIIAFPGSN